MGSPLFCPAVCPIYFWTIVLSQIMVLIATAVDKVCISFERSRNMCIWKKKTTPDQKPRDQRDKDNEEDELMMYQEEEGEN